MSAQVVSSPAGIRLDTKVAALFRLATAGTAVVWGICLLVIVPREVTDEPARVFVATPIVAVFVTAPLLVAGLISLVIGVLLIAAPERGRQAALVFDAVFVIPVSLLLIGSCIRHCTQASCSINAPSMPLRFLPYAVVLAFAAEAAWLLKAWRPLAAFTVVLLVVAFIAPAVADHSRFRHFQPLLDYISDHWVSIPADTRIVVATRPDSSGSHKDSLSFTLGDGPWRIEARHGPGGWQFPGNPYEPVASMRNWYSPLIRIHSGQAAVAHCRRVGILDKKANKFQVFTGPYNEAEYAVYAPTVGGTYVVTERGDLKLYLWRPLVVPDTPK